MWKRIQDSMFEDCGWKESGDLTVLHWVGNWKWGPAANCSKANKKARLVESKVCFILDACNLGWEGADFCPKADSLPPTTSGQEVL